MRAPSMVAVSLLVLGCTAAEKEAPAPDLNAAKADMDSIWSLYSRTIVAGDAEGIARLYSDTVYLAESGLPTLRTGTELRETVKQVLGGVKFIGSTITPEVTEVVGDRIMQFGTYSDQLQEGTKTPQQTYGRFSAVARRSVDGSIRITHLVATLDSTVDRPVKKP